MAKNIDQTLYAWVKLNRLLTGTGRFRATLYHWVPFGTELSIGVGLGLGLGFRKIDGFQ